MTALAARLDAFREAEILADLDVHFARFLGGLAASDAPELALAAALVSRRIGDGHVCLDLAEVAGRVALPGIDDGGAGIDPVVAPPLARWIAALRATSVVGGEEDDRPLVLDRRGRLYLHRYWRYERDLAQALRTRAAAEADDVDVARLRADVAALFPRDDADGTDWQRIAAATAVLRRLCVVSGGPGTGKTTTVLRVLALLLAQDPGLRIALAAPTGKAAARMQEAIRGAPDRLALPAAVRARIPEEATTIHRLLGARRGAATFAHDVRRPLAVDAVVVDEASMIDLALMAKLVAALPARARLVLLGDRDQLASVEAGAVLGDVCGDVPGFSDAFRRRIEEVVGAAVPAGRAATSPLRDAVVLLHRSHRFASGSGIGRIAEAVNRGDASAVIAILRESADTGLAWHAGAHAGAVASVAADGYAPYLSLVREGAPPPAIFAAFRRLRVLCARRRGPFGVETVNRLVEDELRRRRLVARDTGWYAGRPILVTANDYTLGLYNGDVGLTLPDPDDPTRVRVAFEAEGGGVRRLTPARLPAHEPVWAMTVHKSQGSEFDRVLLLLPPEDSPLTTRELLYTAVTRARTGVDLWADEAVVRAAVGRRLVRSSGLREALWGEDGG